MRWTILKKLQAMSLIIVALFSVVLLIMQAYSGQISEKFQSFYQGDFTTSLEFENIKAIQVDSVLNIRGLQISYLLNLSNQTQGYIDTLKKNREITPKLLKNITLSYKGDPVQLEELNRLINDFQIKADLFVKTMQTDANNKAPFPVFKSFMDSYSVLTEFFESFKESVDSSAQNTNLQIHSLIEKVSYSFYIGLMVSLIISFLLSQVIARKISSAAKEIQVVAEKLSHGQLDLYCEINSRDEMGDLAKAINATLVKLKTTITDIQASGELVLRNSDEVLSYNNHVQEGTLVITDNTAVVATAIEELSQTSHNISENISATALAANEINELTLVSLTASEQTSEEIKGLLSALYETSETVNHLKTETSNIETILSVISGISAQTNLLALNAAIEAARAGEQGRGFAVVADEVRALAQRSENSVNEIEAMLVSLTQAGDKTQEQMAHSSEVAHSLSKRVEDSNQLLEEIRDKVMNVNDQSHEIATAAEEQRAVVLDISNNIQQIKLLVEENAETVLASTDKSGEVKQSSTQVQEQLSYFSV
jgi:methyl-accepting chemotaxis protein